MARASSSLLVLALALAGCGASGGGATTIDAGQLVCAPAPDARAACEPDAGGCDFFLQCGCAPADKCTVGDQGASCATAGAKAPGQTCAADAECARGAFCTSFAGATRCLAFCDAAHACPADQACYVVVADRAGHPAGRVCGPTCALLAQDCAAAGFACYVAAEHCVAEEGICLVAGAAGQGTRCARANDCRAGFLCIDPSSSSLPICAKICDRKGSEPACSTGTSCTELPGQTQTGVCLP